MKPPSQNEVTQLLLAWSDGDKAALEELTPLVYAELHRLAERYMRRERAGHPLQTTALVNEAYVRLIDLRKVRWQNRAHFFGVAAQLMRHILVDFAPRASEPSAAGTNSKSRWMKPRWSRRRETQTSSPWMTRSRVWRRLIRAG